MRAALRCGHCGSEQLMWDPRDLEPYCLVCGWCQTRDDEEPTARRTSFQKAWMA